MKLNHQRGSALTGQVACGRKAIVLPMTFGEASFRIPGRSNELKGQVVERIDLVYTDYRRNTSFDQSKLNRARVNSLLKLLPEFAQQPIQWGSIALVGDQDPAEARDKFHGFVIVYRQTAEQTTTNAELEFLSAILQQEKPEIFPKPVEPDNEPFRPDNVAKKPGIGYVIEYQWTAAGDTIAIDTLGIVPDMRGAKKNQQTAPESVRSPASKPDTVVQAVLNRKQAWHDMLIVSDLTSSMSPYTAQILLWLRENEKHPRARMFTFFNDGDQKRNEWKTIGSTGGIYHSPNPDLQSAIGTARVTMINGGGGDPMENDVEALIAGIAHCSDCKEVVLIADNFTPPRDMELMQELDRPVHIVLCGAEGGAHFAYLNLARATGGSVHLIEQDLENLSTIKEGERFNFGNATYLLKNGEFIRHWN